MLLTPKHASATDVANALVDLVPAGIRIRSARLACADDHVQEKPAARRRNEYLTGRRLGRELLQHAGSAELSVGVGTRGMPTWPKGFTGSISHTDDVCAVAVASSEVVRGVGVDIERIEDVVASLETLIRRPDEVHTAVPLAWYFSAKESVFKCQFPLTAEDAEFIDARIIWGASGTFAVDVDDDRLALARHVRGTARRVGPYVVSAGWLQ